MPISLFNLVLALALLITAAEPAKHLSNLSRKRPINTVSLVFAKNTLQIPAARQPNCAKGNNIENNPLDEYDLRCCNDQLYKPGYRRALDEHFSSCNKEPADKTETLVDSQWTFYSCLMERLLGKRRFTLKSFAQAMAGNMTDPEQTKLIEYIDTNSEGAEAVGNWSNRIQVQSAWTAYFDAEFDVCHDDRLDNVDKATARDLYWEPAFTCDAAKVPYIIPFEAKFVTKVIHCAENMRRDLGLSEPQAEGTCMVLSTGILKKEDLRGELDVDTVIDQVLPKTLSARMKSDAIKIGKFNLYKMFYFKGTETFNEMAATIIKLRSWSGLVDRLTESDKQVYSNVLVLDSVVSAVVFDTLETECRSSDS